MGETTSSTSAIAIESPSARRAVRIAIVAIVGVFSAAALALAGAVLAMDAAVLLGATAERYPLEGERPFSPGVLLGATIGLIVGALAGLAVTVWVARLTRREFASREDRV